MLKLAPRAPVPKTNVTPPGLAGSVLVEDEGPIRELLFQYVAAQEPLVAPTYLDFLRAIDPQTRLVAVVPAKSADGGGADEAAALRAFLARADPSGALAARTRIVETEGPITVWSKDRALVLEAPRTQLVVPIRPDPKWRERFNDWATLGAVARAMPERFLVNEVPLEYDAGDFAVTGDKVIVDVNLLAKNEKHGLTTPKALSDFVAATFQRKVVFLGDKDGDLPRHHLSMYMTPIGGGAVLVGDPRAGREVVGDGWTPGEESPDTAEPLVADFSDATIAKFDRAAKDLAAAGFRVERIPVVPFDDKTYLNLHERGLRDAGRPENRLPARVPLRRPRHDRREDRFGHRQARRDRRDDVPPVGVGGSANTCARRLPLSRHHRLPLQHPEPRVACLREVTRRGGARSPQRPP